MLLSDAQDYIWKTIISPWRPKQRTSVLGEPIFSRGQGSYSYDITMAGQIKVPNLAKTGVLDPKRVEPDDWTELDVTAQGYYDLPAHSSMLLSIDEFLDIPMEYLALFLGKSSYARCSVHPHITPAEPGWYGHLVVEVSNMLHRPVRLYVGEGIAAMILIKGESVCEAAYQGSYQAQERLTTTQIKGTV